MDEIVRCVEVDSGLAAAVVRLSRSAFYGGHDSVSSLPEAIQRVGLAEVLKMAAMVSNLRFLEVPLTCYQVEPMLLWEESLAAAIVMEFMAHDNGEDPPRAYLVGLLHNIGKFPVARLMAKLKPTMFADPFEGFMELARWEREQIGFDHARVGGMLLQRWGFAPELYLPLMNHLHPALTMHGRKVAAMLHIARVVTPCVIDPEHVPFAMVDVSNNLLSSAEARRDDLEAYIPNATAWFNSTLQSIQPQLASA